MKKSSLAIVTFVMAMLFVFSPAESKAGVADYDPVTQLEFQFAHVTAVTDSADLKTDIKVDIKVAMLDETYAGEVVGRGRGCDKDGKNCTHRCTLNGRCLPVPKKLKPTQLGYQNLMAYEPAGKPRQNKPPI